MVSVMGRDWDAPGRVQRSRAIPEVRRSCYRAPVQLVSGERASPPGRMLLDGRDTRRSTAKLVTLSGRSTRITKSPILPSL